MISGRITDPNYDIQSIEYIDVASTDGTLFYSGNSWLQKNDHGLYELYVEGNALEMGYTRGLLSKSLIQRQEELFIDKIQEMIPSKIYLLFLKEIIAWFNRNLPDFLIEEHLQELFAISRFASDDFDFIGSKYQRILNYHAAHDIGHALENYELVGCTSFSTVNPDSNTFIIGRNFDFSMGEKFAENKVVCFYSPDIGYDFMMISWSDFIGCVSGMNLKGLTITLNAGESQIPTEIGTPISLVAREILQHASNIDEAYAIALKRKTFVSESMLVGSAEDGYSVIIEKTPDTTLLFKSSDNKLICSNHFQSDYLKNQSYSSNFVSSSQYRYERVHELFNDQLVMDEKRAAYILRDQQGLNNTNIGLGNEKSINQLVAHHSIIFKPDELKFWISTPPYQLGKYLCYDLNEIFTKRKALKEQTVIYIPELSISEDPLLNNTRFNRFRVWKKYQENIENAIENKVEISGDSLQWFIDLNAEHYYSYEIIGDYHSKMNHLDDSKKMYDIALTKEIPYKTDVDRIQGNLNNLKEL